MEIKMKKIDILDNPETISPISHLVLIVAILVGVGGGLLYIEMKRSANFEAKQKAELIEKANNELLNKYCVEPDKRLFYALNKLTSIIESPQRIEFARTGNITIGSSNFLEVRENLAEVNKLKNELKKCDEVKKTLGGKK